MHFSLVKKILILLAAGGLISLSFISPVRSQGGDIVVILKAILDRVNDLPQSLEKLGKFEDNWTDADASKTTGNRIVTFQQLGQLLSADIAAQTSMQGPLNALLLSNDGDNLKHLNDGEGLTGKAPNAQTMKYANDLVYSSLLGVPFYPKDPRENIDYTLNYILNASGSNIYHEMPTGGFNGIPASRRRYQGFYNTVMAATTFNNYVLSGLVADKNQFNTLQQTLIQQATDPVEWFKEVGGENLGIVLRQILLYQSQTFVLLTQLLQLQKQLVTAQVMNTAVLIANGQVNEASLTAYAKGQQPEF